MQTAVIDNASLVYLTNLHAKKPFFQQLRYLYQTIYFPSEIINEYGKGLPKQEERSWILSRLNPDVGFYRHCNTYDSITLSIVQGYKGIHKGEAEVYAQYRKVNANLIISDDKEFIEALKGIDKTIRVYTTLHLICHLDHASLLNNWKDLLIELYYCRKFTSEQLRKAYCETAQILGINVHKKTISAKCSLKKILS